MFKRLEKEITIYNAAILIVFLIIFCTSVYTFMKGTMDKSVEKLIRKRMDSFKHIQISKDFKIPQKYIRRPHNPPDKNEQTPFFDFKMKIDFIIYDDNKELRHASSLQIEENIEEFSKLLGYEKNIEEERIVKAIIDDREYRVLTYRIKNDNFIYIQIIQDYEINKAFLYNLLIMLLTVGGVSVAVLILISRKFAKRSLIPVKESWQKQKNFVADASHELRTPLAVVQINLEAAMSDKEKSIKDNEIWLENAISETKMMGELVNELLMLARIDAKDIYIKNDIINLSLISQEISQQMEVIFKTKNIIFHRSIEDKIFIKGDRTKIRQLMVILLDNAVKYNSLGGEIYLKVVKEAEAVLISIKDTGIGIAEEDLKHIFDRFFMVNKSRSKENGGNGLGLSIAKWIVEVHRGQIYVESKKDVGSTFKVRFPRII